MADEVGRALSAEDWADVAVRAMLMRCVTAVVLEYERLALDTARFRPNLD